MASTLATSTTIRHWTSSISPAKLLILVACTTIFHLATASQAFESNKIYQYDFEGAITNKVADDAARNLFSGLAISSKVLVKKSGSDEITVRFYEPKASVFNEQIDDIHLHRFDYKPLEAGEQQLSAGLDKAFRIYFEDGSVRAFDSHKEEPKWVTNFKRGLLSFFQLKLTVKSVNQLDGSALTTSDNDNSNGLGGSRGSRPTPSASGQYYTTPEKSVFGECETDYLIMDKGSVAFPTAEDIDQPAFSVTKTRNMARCKSRFLHRFMPIDSSECFDNERDLQQYKHSNAIFQYDLVGTRQNYIIKSVLLDEATTFSPFGQKAHTHLASTKFMLQFHSIIDASSTSNQLITVDETSSVRLESLSYDPPEMLNFYANVNLDNEHHLGSIYQTSASVERIMEAFDAIVGEHRSYMGAFETAGEPNSSEGANSSATLEKSRIAEMFLRLNELVGTMNLSNIEQLYAQVDERGEAYKRVFWDLISVTGTNPSFVFMKRLITDGDAPSVKIKDFLTRLSFHIKMPSKQLFDEYVNLCKSDKIQTNQQYKRLCLLPLASLIHQHCAKPHARYLRLQSEGANATVYKKAQNTCQIATAEEYFTRLVATFGSSAGSMVNATAASGGPATGSGSARVGGGAGSVGVGGGSSGASGSSDELSTGDKMFNIKMAGELGVRPSIDFLLDVVANRDEHPSLRAAAMWNLHKAARIYPNLIKRAVVPHYYDSNELLEVRLAAFHNWLAAGLTLHETQTMAKRLFQEPSRQVVVYVHSLIDSMARLSELAPSSSSPSVSCLNANNKHARLVLPTVKKALSKHSEPSWTDSRASMSAYYNNDYGYGSASMMSVIFSNDSMAPTNMHYSTSEIMSGLRFSPVTVSIQAHGLDKLIKRVVGINGLLADKDSFMDVFSLKRRSKRQAVDQLIKQEANEIDKELSLSVRDFSDVYIVVTVSAYGRPVTFFERDSRELKKMIGEDGTIKVPQIKKLLHSFNNHTTQQMMVTFEKFEVFNNELGLPLFRSIVDFEYKTFKLNSIKLDVEPGFFRDERQGKPPTRITTALDSKMGRHNEVFVSTGTLVPHAMQQVGVGFHKKKLLNLPLKFSIEANMAENRVSLKRWPNHDSILYIRQTPVTFVKTYDPNRPVRDVYGSNDWKPLYSMNDSTQTEGFNLDVPSPLSLPLGLAFRLSGRHRSGQDWSMAAWRRYLSAVGLQGAKFMFFYSPNGAPLESRLSMITTKENPTNEQVISVSWRHHHRYTSAANQLDDQQLNEVEKELETAISQSSGEQVKPPTTVSYKLTMSGGSTKERKVTLDLAYSRSFDRLMHKWRVFYQSTPYEQSSSESPADTNICWLGRAQFPRHSADRLLAFDLLNLDHSANVSSEFTFGDECSETRLGTDQTRLSARATFEWSQEQREAIEQALNNPKSTSNRYAKLLRQCQQRRELFGARLDLSCLDAMRKMSELNHVRAEFDHANVPERFTRLVRRLGSLYTYARAGYIDEIDDKSQSDGSSSKSGREYKSPDGKMMRSYLEANITDYNQMATTGLDSAGSERKLSYEFDTSTYHVVYKNVPIRVPPLTTFALLDDNSYYQMLQSTATKLMCSINGQTVQTFDNLNYTMPPISEGCFKLIAKDCSPEANYIVLGAKVGPTGKVVKVYVAQKFKIEFVPDKDGKHISDIKVNGETVNLADSATSGKPLFRGETKLGSRIVEAFTIDYNGAFYTLKSKLYRFSVNTDGTWILVQQSKYYAGKSCGLCGDADGDQQHEFKAPSSPRRVCKNASDFVWSHVLPSTCASRPTHIECA